MSIRVQKASKASSPLVIHINIIENNFPKTHFAVYFQLPHLRNVFKNINKLQEITIIKRQIIFKIVEYQSTNASDLEASHVKIGDSVINKVDLSISNMKSRRRIDKHNQDFFLIQGIVQISENGTMECEVNHMKGSIKLKGSLINQNFGNSKIFDLAVDFISGYEDFYNFRKKYKTLQNITKKIEFKLNHRIKIVQIPAIVTQTSTFDLTENINYFSMDEDDTKHYFISTQKAIKIIIEEIYSIEDRHDVKEIHQQIVNLKALGQQSIDQWSYRLILTDKSLEITFSCDLIRNQNLAQSGLLSLRVLQVKNQNPDLNQNCIFIGTDTNKNCKKLLPVLDGIYYDYQYGYLCKNLKEISTSEIKFEQIYQNLSKLTPFKPKYPHFINQSILDVRSNLSLQISIGKDTYSLPFVYILKGYNIFHAQRSVIKIFVEFNSKLQLQQSAIKANIQSMAPFSEKSDKRRMFQLQIKDFWNLSEIRQKQFNLKIFCPGLIQMLPFTTSTVDWNTFKKQQKQLQIKTQFSQKLGDKFVLIWQNEDNKKNRSLSVIQAENIQQFYLLELTGASSIFFEILSNDTKNQKGKVIMSNHISRKNIIRNSQVGADFPIILTSNDSKKMVVLICSLRQIAFEETSSNSLFAFRYRLQFPDEAQSHAKIQTYYDLELKAGSDLKNRKSKVKKFRKKITPESYFPKAKHQVYKIMKEFAEDPIFAKSDQMNLQVSFRKMFYDEEVDIFDNEVLIEKQFNLAKIPGDFYETFEMQCYDQNVKQRLKLYIQAFRKNSQIIDQSHYRYCLRVPSLLWKFNKTFKINENENIDFQVLLSNKKKKTMNYALPFLSGQQFRFSGFNYKDALCLKIGNQIGFSRIVDCVKLKCQIMKDKLGWIKESEWFLSIINVGERAFYFLLKYEYDPEQQQDSEDSAKTTKTVSKQKKQEKGKVDNLAKTLRNVDIHKLKQQKNTLTQQNRHLTAKIVARQQKIAALYKKIQQIEDNMKKTAQKEQQIRYTTSSNTENLPNKAALIKLYREICECGQRNPKHNGYCDNCLNKLKQRYTANFKDYNQTCQQYQKIQFQKHNWKEKLQKLKNKRNNYNQLIKNGKNIQDNNIEAVIGDLENKDLRRRIEQLNIEIFSLREERSSLTETAKFQQNALEQKIKIQDQLIIKRSQQLQSLKAKLNHIRYQIQSDQNKK